MQMLLARALRWYLRTNLRGRTRLTAFATKLLKPLWSVPIRIAGCAPVYVDLRFPHAQHLLRGEPWARAPWERAEQDAMRRVVSPGMVVLDVGANMGLHTVLLASLVGPTGRVFVFEPNAALLPPLRRTVQGLGNASLYPYALSDEAGPGALFVPEDNMKASLANWTDEATDGKAQAGICERRRLDDLVRAGTVAQPDFIKCDVEGAELLVFRGARAVLDRPDAPIVLFEVNAHTAKGFGFATGAAKEFLEGLPAPRYRFFEVQREGPLRRVDVLDPWLNVLAIPEAKLPRFPELR
jgi:FkbM family methyltransferase